MTTPPSEITISIDGVEIKTQLGKMVLEAAIEAGVYVPYLCYHPGMKPFGACRMCVVAEEGGRGFPAACTLPVRDGMKIRSNAEDVQKVRHSVMEMLIAEHPNGCLTCHRIDLCGPEDICLRHVSVNDRCLTCPKNERCEFKDTVRYLTMELESPLNYTYRNEPLHVNDPFYDRDYNLCIVCGRCVRACEEIRGDDAICFINRSGKALVGTSFGTSLLESGCEFCGACIDVCPVGALVERPNKWEKPRRVARTICPHCPVGCQLNLEVNAAGRVIRVIPEFNAPANRGQACYKGKFGLEFINNKERLRKPLIRRNGELQEATWGEALEYMAARLAEHKGDAFGLITSDTGTNEEHYLAQKFARLVMGTNNVDHSSNLQPDLAAPLEQALGYAAATNPIWDLEQAGCILVFNSNLTEAQNVVGVPIKRAARRSARLIVIDSREVELTRYAHHWLRPVPGTELLLLSGILRSIIDQGLEKKEWLEQHCEDPATLHYALNGVSLEEIALKTQVPLNAINEAARVYAGANKAAIVYGLDNISANLQQECGRALVDLALLTGNVGQPGTGIYPLRQGANAQGAWDMGAVPNRLPGYRRVSDDASRQGVESLWGAPLPLNTGRGLGAMLDAASNGDLKAMFVIGDSPNFANGALGDSLAALRKLDFLAVQDTFRGPLTELAHVVLPRAAFAEKEGTYTNLERRVQRLRPALKLRPEANGDQASYGAWWQMAPEVPAAFRDNHARPEGWTLCELARLMGASGFAFASPAAVMDEIASVNPHYAGISYARLEQSGRVVFRTRLESPQPTQVLYSSREERGLQWPCLQPGAPDTPILCADGFPQGKADPVTPDFRREPPPALSQDYPLWLAPGRVLLQRDRETKVELQGKANRILRDEVAQVNPADAARLNVADGERVALQTEQGALEAIARLDASVPAGVVAVTWLFGQLAADLQASAAPNPMSKVPGLDVAPVRVVKAAVAAARPG